MRKCQYCGFEFNPTQQKQIYCSKKCYRASFRSLKPEDAGIKVKNRNERLERLAREADEHGMSYGYYVAWLRQQEEKKNENVDDNGVADAH